MFQYLDYSYKEHNIIIIIIIIHNNDNNHIRCRGIDLYLGMSPIQNGGSYLMLAINYLMLTVQPVSRCFCTLIIHIHTRSII